MNYILSRIIDFILGYFLQSLACALNIYALNKKKIDIKLFAVMTVLFSICTLIIRNINIINFGYHTILIIAAFVLISITIFKFPIYSTALAMLMSTIMIMLCEIVNYLIMYSIIGEQTVSLIMTQSGIYENPIYKSLLGIPTNIILVIVSYFIYRLTTKNNIQKKTDKSTDTSDNTVKSDSVKNNGGVSFPGNR